MSARLRQGRLRQLFDHALELDPLERQAFLERECTDDPALRQEIERLLAREASNHSFLAEDQLMRAGESLIDAAMPLLNAGQQLGRFRITGLIGGGGMGRVFRAERVEGDITQRVAIKLVRSELLEPALLSRFSNERRVLASLSHPGICRFIDAGTSEDGAPYIAMELVEGRPLLQYCKDERLDLAARIDLLRRIVAAVSYAHGRLVVHRDIKSDNVLVGSDGEPRLLDFGIAKHIEHGGGQVTITEQRFFTPGNVSPEQLLGQPASVSCDIYSLGVLAYELVCGAPPYDFDGLRPAEIERRILEVPPPPPSERLLPGAEGDAIARATRLQGREHLKRKLKGDIDAVVLTCLRKLPRERYSSAEQFEEELSCLLAGLPVRARRGDHLYRMRKFVARHRTTLSLSAGLVLTLVGATAGLAIQSAELAEQRNRAVVERDRAQEVALLLQNAFVAADPAQVAGEDISLRHVLASARPRMEALRGTRPDLYSALAGTLAKVELDLASDAATSELTARALEAARRANASASQLRELSLLHARALTSAGQPDLALEVLAHIERDASAEDPAWLLEHARALTAVSRYDDAVVQLRKGISATQASLPEDELATQLRTMLADTLFRAGSTRQALASFAATLSWQRERLSDDHPWVALTRLRRVNVLIQAQELDEAVAEAEKIAASIATQYGENSTLTALARSTLAHAYHAGRQTTRAIELQREAVTQWVRSLGSEHPRTLRANFNLAQILSVDPANRVEAEERFREALTGSEARFGVKSNATVFFRLSLARFLGRTGRWEEALRMLTSKEAREGLEVAIAENRRDHFTLLDRAVKEAGCDEPESLIKEPCTLAGIMASLRID